MSGRQTLLLFIVVVIVTGALRFWMADRLERYEDGLREHVEAWETILEKVQTINFRRQEIPRDEGAGGALTHFQDQARVARVGVVNVSSQAKPNSRRQYRDDRFTIEFEATNPSFTREQIANFLYNSETQMTRMRCTKLSMSPFSTRSGRGSIPSGQDRADLWKISSLEFTRRTPTRKGE